MLFSTPSEFAVLALVLIAGWLFGLASHPGGRKWKERYATERDAHAAYRRDTDPRIAEAEARAAAAETHLADADKRAAELYRDREQTAQTAPATTYPVPPRATTVVTPRGSTTTTNVTPHATAAAQPAHSDGERRGWFDWNRTAPNR